MRLLGGLRKALDRVTRPFREGQSDTELVESGIELPNTRYWRRAVARADRKHGPGYTRSMRKGRRVKRDWPS